MEQKHLISRPNQTGQARSRIKTTTNEQSWTIENANRLVYTCFAMMQFFFAWGKKSQSSLHWDCIPFFVKCNQSENHFRENLTTSNRTKEVKKECNSGHKNDAQSPWKNLEAQPISSLHKKCRFLTTANEIRMHSLVPRERNYLCKLCILNQSKSSIINNHF